MDWPKPEEKEDAVKIPPNWLFIHYYEALNALFRIENALRMLVFVVLKSQLGDEWLNLSIFSDDGGDTTIHALARKRSEQDAAFGYLGFPTNSPLMHLTSGELVRLLTSDSYWPRFAGYFPATKAAVVLKLQEIGNVRNALAHFRPLRTDDVEVVKQNANQVLSGVEKELTDVIECSDRVPTNTDEQWFKDLSTLGSDAVSVRLHQSRNLRWLRLVLCYNCLELRRWPPPPSPPSSYATYEVLNVRPTSILRAYDDLRRRVAIVTERMPYLGFEQVPTAKVTKELHFTFPREAVEAHASDIRPLVEEVMSRISTEADLIGKDNLAKGQIVNITHISAQKKKIEDREYWSYDLNGVKTPASRDDPPEYWGALETWTRDFLTDTQDYPWMSTTVSDFAPL